MKRYQLQISFANSDLFHGLFKLWIVDVIFYAYRFFVVIEHLFYFFHEFLFLGWCLFDFGLGDVLWWSDNIGFLCRYVRPFCWIDIQIHRWAWTSIESYFALAHSSFFLFIIFTSWLVNGRLLITSVFWVILISLIKINSTIIKFLLAGISDLKHCTLWLFSYI